MKRDRVQARKSIGTAKKAPAVRRRTRTKIVAAQEFHLHDEKGKLRGLLSARGGCTRLSLRDAKERERILIQVEPDGRAVISVLNELGTQSLVGLSVDPNHDDAGLGICHADSMQAIQIGCSFERGPQITIFDRKGRQAGEVRCQSS